MAHPLWKHQEAAITMANTERDLALLMDPGVGKTRTAIEIIRRRFATAGRVRKTLILAPIVVCENWKREFAQYSKVDQKDILVLTRAGKVRVNEFVEAVGPTLSGNKVVITNYQGMLMKELYALLLKWQPEILVCDESQRVKNPKAKQAVAVAAIADRTFHNYILTGTPVLNSAMDLFMQYRIMDRGATFGKNFFGFREQYFYDKNAWMNKDVHFPKFEPRPQSYAQLQEKIKAKSVRAVKSECLDLPPFVRQKIMVDMSGPQRKLYDAMKKEFIAFVETAVGPRAVVAQLAITKLLRLQQIVSGFAKDEEGVVHRFSDCPRLDALQELLEDLVAGHKVIVWATFIENYAMVEELCTRMGVKYTTLTGSDTAAQKNENIDEFRSNPDVRVMIANQSAGGVGVTLVEADYMIYYSKGTRLEDDLQSEARAYRGGSEMHSSITRIDLVCAGTTDEQITESLLNKQQIGEQILNWRGII